MSQKGLSQISLKRFVSNVFKKVCLKCLLKRLSQMSQKGLSQMSQMSLGHVFSRYLFKKDKRHLRHLRHVSPPLVRNSFVNELTLCSQGVQCSGKRKSSLETRARNLTFR